jgi:hypothetical protein
LDADATKRPSLHAADGRALFNLLSDSAAAAGEVSPPFSMSDRLLNWKKRLIRPCKAAVEGDDAEAEGELRGDREGEGK